MDMKNTDWSNLGFSYIKTDKRFVANFKDGKWDDGVITDDATVTISECAGVLQYAQTCFEGLKAYTTEDGSVVTFRPDLNADRMIDSCKRLQMPIFPKEKFIQAVKDMKKRFGIGDKIKEICKEDIPKLARYADREANPLYPVPVLMDAKELELFYNKLLEEQKMEAEEIGKIVERQ